MKAIEILKDIQRETTITQEEWAKEANYYGQSMIGNSARRSIRLEKLFRLAEVLDVQIILRKDGKEHVVKMENVFDTLKAIKRDAGINQKVWAERAGYTSDGAVSSALSRNPQTSTFVRLVTALDAEFIIRKGEKEWIITE